MKIEVNKKPVLEFKPFQLNLTVESAVEQELLRIALQHYAGRHVHIPSNKDVLRQIADAVAAGAV